MFRGLATISYFADDLAAAKEWYTQLLGVEAYYAFPHDGPPAYVEFRIGDYQHELGLIDRRFAPHQSTAGAAGVVAFWHVDDLPAAMARLRAMGATAHEDVTEREDGFVTASVVDPFGNVLGVMYNPHYLEILEAIKGAGPSGV